VNNNIHLCDAGDNLFSVWHLHPGETQCLGYARRGQVDSLVERHLKGETTMTQPLDRDKADNQRHASWLRGYLAGLRDCALLINEPTQSEAQDIRDAIDAALLATAKAEGNNLLCTGCGQRSYSAADVANLDNKNCECGAPLVNVRP